MATTGARSPLAKEPKEDQTGVSATVGGSLPAGGRDMGAQRPQVTQPGREERRRRKKEPTKNGVRPKEQLCLSKQRRRPQSWRI
jgi:hypothetical protein